jgi:hypothetical protein
MLRVESPHTDELNSQRPFSSPASYKGLTSNSLDTIRVFILLAITIWVAHFWHSAGFGLYADDYINVSQALASSSRVWSYVKKAVLTFEYGRPVGYAFLGLFSFLGSKLGGLRGIYWILYIIVTLNSCLFYTLLKRLSPYPGFALIGALAFSLFPADATHAFLTHLEVYPSLTFLLIAFHCYLSAGIKLSYLVILGTLLSYETAFPVFLAAPLLKGKWGSSLIRELIRHGSILGAMFVGVAVLHMTSGDIRLAKLGVLATLQMSFLQMILGPVTSMAMFVYRPFTTLRSMTHEPAVFLPLCVAGLAWGLLRVNLGPVSTVKDTAPTGRTTNCFRHLSELASLGLVMLILAYPLVLTLPATSIDGRGSRVHIAAAVGASVLCSCACLAILSVAGRFGKKKLATVGLTFYFGLLVGFGLTVQEDYRLSWQYQRAFWTDLVRLCPDIDNETVILVEPTGLLNTRMDAFNWATSFGLQQIYQFFPNYEYFDRLRRKPQVHILLPGWQEKIVSNGQSFELNDLTTLSLSIIYGSVKSSNVIFLEAHDGRLTRRTEPLIIDGQEFPLKQVASSRDQPLKKGHLYPYLIRSSNEQPVRYLK